MSKSLPYNASASPTRARRRDPDKAPACGPPFWRWRVLPSWRSWPAPRSCISVCSRWIRLRRAFSGGAAAYEGMTAYNDRTMTDFWADARTTQRGVTRYDPARAANGLTLYSSAHEQSAYLMDMQGKVVHRWHLNFSALWDDSAAVKRPRGDDFIHYEKAQVLPNGDLIALYTAIGDTPWGYGIAKLNAQSQVIWKYLGHAHHDFAVDDAGNVHVLSQQVVETEHLPGFAHLPKPRIDDFLVTLSPDGKERTSVPLMDVFAASPYDRRLYFASQEKSCLNGDYLHANSVDILQGPVAGIPNSRAGQALISFREISAVALIDTGEPIGGVGAERPLGAPARRADPAQRHPAAVRQ